MMFSQFFKNAIICGVFLFTAMLQNAHSETNAITIRVDHAGRRLEGKPLNWTKQQILLLCRDGYLWEFAADQASGYKKISSEFEPFSRRDQTKLLKAEFGHQFDVTTTTHFVIMHPKGQKTKWTNRFEGLYHSFSHYFNVRGFDAKDPEFLMIATIYPTKEQFQKQAFMEGANISDNVLGYYSPRTNRILLYDVTTKAGGQSWSTNADTIIHEATHQTAFNIGLHNRFGENPRWVVEGLGVMFEMRGVWHSKKYPFLVERIHRQQLVNFRNYREGYRKKDALADIIQSDRIFGLNPFGAYSEAWALTFYLAEKHPQKYIQYISKIAERKQFTKYTAPERLRDFTEVFGDNLPLLDSQFLRYIGSLPH
ncbi:MAG: hypothetical protein ACI9G1_000248 [Pirellulaceae bacterium]|jgi:hypothetical protein